jgi:exopolysaccharide biosynthesis predicted pyruvyltransferase EpsI
MLHALTESVPPATPGDGLTVMRQLSAKVEEISVLVPPGRPVIYLDYPVHLNVGDMLIEAGTECFFKRFDMNVIVRRSAYDFGEAARRRVTSLLYCCRPFFLPVWRFPCRSIC